MSEPLWTLAALLELTKGRLIGPEPKAIDGISIDSRTTESGDAFFAIRGDRFDGHDFIAAALAGGAVLAVVGAHRLVGLGRITAPLVVVDDVTKALRRLAVGARSRATGKIVAVTGSVGKTTTKDMLRAALGRSGSVHAAPASFNNHWGVPLTLARMPAHSAYGVFEIGMNHPGEIAPLAAMVRPHVAIVTTVEPVHIEAFESVEAIADAKAEIFTGIEAGGAAILNRDNPHFERLALAAGAADAARIIGFGKHPDADARLEDASLGPAGSAVRARIDGRPMSYAVGIAGLHMVINSLAVLAAALFVGADLDAAAASLAGISPGKGRGTRSQLQLASGTALLIDESYNANPASMRAAIGVLGRIGPGGEGRRIAVLGDMLELGQSELALHAALVDVLETARVDRVHLVGERMAALWEVLPPDRRGVYAVNADGLAAALADDLRPGDVMMVKGSNGIRLGALVEALRQQFGAAAKEARQGAR